MKNVIFCLLAIILLISCSNYKKEGNMYVSKIEVKNGASTMQKIKYKLDPYIVDTLKLSKEQVEKIIIETCDQAKERLKNPLSFELLPETEYSSFIYYINQEIRASVDCIGQNAFGVKQKNTVIVIFDSKNLSVKQVL